MDGADLEHVLRMWGPCEDACCRGDINRDGWVDELDLMIVINSMRTYDAATFVRCRESHDPDSPACGQ